MKKDSPFTILLVVIMLVVAFYILVVGAVDVFFHLLAL